MVALSRRVFIVQVVTVAITTVGGRTNAGEKYAFLKSRGILPPTAAPSSLASKFDHAACPHPHVMLAAKMLLPPQKLTALSGRRLLSRSSAGGRGGGMALRAAAEPQGEDGGLLSTTDAVAAEEDASIECSREEEEEEEEGKELGVFGPPEEDDEPSSDAPWDSVTADEILAGLNPAQKSAVCAPLGPVCVSAVPGSGKTKVLAERISYLVCNYGVSPKRILAVSFTKAAALEMKERIRMALRIDTKNPATVGTFHSVCMTILRDYGGGSGLIPAAAQGQIIIASQSSKDRALEEALSQAGIPMSASFAKAVKKQISLLKGRGVMVDVDLHMMADASQGGAGPGGQGNIAEQSNLLEQDLGRRRRIEFAKQREVDRIAMELEHMDARGDPSSKHFKNKVAAAYGVYQKYLEAKGELDFDDLLLRAHVLLQKNPNVLDRVRARWRHVLVDELQDCNKVQYDLVHTIAPPGRQQDRSVLVVGDVDQSIYGFRGSGVDTIGDFKQDYADATVIALEKNYRSTSSIIELSSLLSPSRDGKKVVPAKDDSGTKPTISRHDDQDEEARSVARRIAEQMKVVKGEKSAQFSDVAVLYRSNYQSQALEDAFKRNGIPYALARGSTPFWERQEVASLVHYVRLLADPNDEKSLVEVINEPSRRIGQKSVDKLLAQAAARNLNPQGILIEMLKGDLAQVEESFTSGQISRMAGFADIMRRILKSAVGENPGKIIENICDILEFKEYLIKKHGDASGESRWENVLELIRIATRSGGTGREGVERFLGLADPVSLEGGSVRGAVQLMTLHSSKGLEFGVVYIVGLEEELVPHKLSCEDENLVDEERRLLYVGCTRAKRELHLNWCKGRLEYAKEEKGKDKIRTNKRQMSRFLADLGGAVKYVRKEI